MYAERHEVRFSAVVVDDGVVARRIEPCGPVVDTDHDRPYTADLRAEVDAIEPEISVSGKSRKIDVGDVGAP